MDTKKDTISMEILWHNELMAEIAMKIMVTWQEHLENAYLRHGTKADMIFFFKLGTIII